MRTKLMTDRHVPRQLVSPTAAALSLGVDVATLQRWNIFGYGPASASGLDGAALAYRHRDLEVWQDRLGVTIAGQ
jgi:hypothetical protein